ncbi:MAG: hypothetical protein N3F65_03940 [Nitrososphaeria archaeon]|nr:hypothetical protein [Nitrososphaeria archaeon]MDW8021833.1 hypothetical protein [Nitrososphaerota archaeon]
MVDPWLLWGYVRIYGAFLGRSFSLIVLFPYRVAHFIDRDLGCAEGLYDGLAIISIWITAIGRGVSVSVKIFN